MPSSRDPHYYDDSDDMVERIRKAREAFDQKTKAFQGPDWPYYEKREIVGRKKKEEMEASAVEDTTVVSANADLAPTSSAQLAVEAGSGGAESAEQRSEWWTARRSSQEVAAATANIDQVAHETTQSDNKADS